MRPEVGDPVSFNGKTGVIVSLTDHEGLVDDVDDAAAVVIAWEDGTFSAILISDLEYTRLQ